MKIFKKQGWHLLAAIVLVSLTGMLVHRGLINVEGSLWGLSSQRWLDIALLTPIVHQLYVLLCWRLELHQKAMTKRFGKKAFPIYVAGFFILFFGRFASIIILAIANAKSVETAPVVIYILTGIVALIGGYAMYSTVRFFGMERAAGKDYFDPEAMKDLPLVNQGIFKYTSNGMYVFALGLLYLPGLIAFSSAAIAAAAFNHIFIWAHFYFTEKPDMKEIYGD